MINSKHMKPYKSWLRPNKVNYSTYDISYCTMIDMKVPFRMPYISGRNIMTHCFHVDIQKGESGIVYDMIIVHDLMVELEFGGQF